MSSFSAKAKPDWEYKSFLMPVSDRCRARNSPVPDHRDVEEYLNDKVADGWEFVGQYEKHWKGSEPFTQTFDIFRRRVN